MTKHFSTPIPSLTGSSSQAAQQVVQLLDQSRAMTHLSTAEHFARSLGIWQAVLDQAKMGPWLCACAGMEKGLAPLCQALAILVEQALSNYQDILGRVYLVLSQTEGRLGQHFTPTRPARVLTEICLTGIRPPAPGEPALILLEPCCGSGAMILAAAETIERLYPDMIVQGAFQFFGIDLDPICVAMCNLNLRLHGVGRIAKLINELSDEERAAIERVLGTPLHQVLHRWQMTQEGTPGDDSAMGQPEQSVWKPLPFRPQEEACDRPTPAQTPAVCMHQEQEPAVVPDEDAG
jgi:hypothetical protein